MTPAQKAAEIADKIWMMPVSTKDEMIPVIESCLAEQRPHGAAQKAAEALRNARLISFTRLNHPGKILEDVAEIIASCHAH